MPKNQPPPPPDGLKFRWDFLLFIWLIVTAIPEITGARFHEWVSLLFIPILLIHLVFNWRWIIEVTKRTFKSLSGEVRFNQILNTLLFVVMTTVMVSGILISHSVLPAFGLPVQSDPFWHGLHESSARILLVVLGVHLAMHARWILARLRRAPSTDTAQKESI